MSAGKYPSLIGKVSECCLASCPQLEVLNGLSEEPSPSPAPSPSDPEQVPETAQTDSER